MGHRPRNLPLLLLVTRFREHENECEQANCRGNADRLEHNAAAQQDLDASIDRVKTIWSNLEANMWDTS